MADSAVPITAGTGTNIDTRTEGTNSNHRQVIVVGDPATNAGVAPVDATNGLAVQVIPALPAGTNNIGDVDVLSVVPGTGATNLGKAEDAAHSTGDTGVMVLAVRKDSAAASSGTDGDYEPLSTDASGNLRVASHPVTNAGTFAVQVDGNALTSLQLIDDAIVADDAAFTPATTKLMMAGFEYDDTTPDSVDEGDAGAARMSANRNIYTQIRDAAGNERGANVNASGQLNVTGPVTNAGTFAVQVDGNALTALQLIDDPVFTDDAAFTPGSSKVMMAGAQFDNSGTDSVDEGDAGALRMSANRNLYVNIRDNAGNERGLNIDANGAAAVTNSAGEAHIGEVGGKTVIKTITMTATTSILASADIIADTQQLDAAFRVADGTGVLQSMTVFDPDDNTAFAFDVYIHRTTTSMGTENSGISISDANAAAGIIGVVSFATTDAKDLINGKMYHKTNLGIPVSAVSGTDDLYFSVVNGSGTPTFAGGSIPIVVGLLLD